MSHLSKYANFYFGVFVSCVRQLILSYFNFIHESLFLRINIVFFAGTVIVKLLSLDSCWNHQSCRREKKWMVARNRYREPPNEYEWLYYNVRYSLFIVAGAVGAIDLTSIFLNNVMARNKKKDFVQFTFIRLSEKIIIIFFSFVSGKYYIIFMDADMRCEIQICKWILLI